MHGLWYRFQTFKDIVFSFWPAKHFSQVIIDLCNKTLEVKMAHLWSPPIFADTFKSLKVHPFLGPVIFAYTKNYRFSRWNSLAPLLYGKKNVAFRQNNLSRMRISTLTINIKLILHSRNFHALPVIPFCIDKTHSSKQARNFNLSIYFRIIL